MTKFADPRPYKMTVYVTDLESEGANILAAEQGFSDRSAYIRELVARDADTQGYPELAELFRLKPIRGNPEHAAHKEFIIQKYKEKFEND